MIIAKERKRHIVVSDYYIIKPYYTEWHRPVLSASGLRKFGAQIFKKSHFRMKNVYLGTAN